MQTKSDISNFRVVDLTLEHSNFTNANRGRDYAIYARAMDAAENVKAHEIFPKLQIPEGGALLDLGAGTGALAELAAREFSHAKVYAQDVSHELLEIANHRRALTKLVFGDALDQKFPENSLDGAYCSSCGHEIETFAGKDAMKKVLAVIIKELKPDATFVIRDFVKPDTKMEVYMRIADTPNTTPTTEELFYKFHREFKGGGAFSFECETINGEKYFRLPAEWAYEFIMRKDYVANWNNEIKEKYSYWTPKEAEIAFNEAGFCDVQVNTITNEWIVQNRLIGQVELYIKDDNGNLDTLPYFPTHMVVSGKKPKIKALLNAPIPELSYDSLIDSIKVSAHDDIIQIDQHKFRLSQFPNIVGSKRVVGFLQGEPRRVIKFPRLDGINVHNCFKAMYQTIERQHVLKEYNVPHLEIVDYDHAGPPYRYLVQRALPDNAKCAADLICSGELTEKDISQMAAIINKFEENKQWQLDTNPFNWFRVEKEDGSTEMTYADGKVYRYDERWSFSRVGLIQWSNPEFLRAAKQRLAPIPTVDFVNSPKLWWDEESQLVQSWKKYLHTDLLTTSNNSVLN